MNRESKAGGIKVGLVQVNNSFSNYSYFPYSLGILQAYAEKHLPRGAACEFLTPVYKRMAVDEAAEMLSGADIVFFSVYMWNAKISAEIAQEVRRRKPGALVVFGGPEVPLRKGVPYMESNTFIDIACRGEGEGAFLGVLENFRARSWAKVPSLWYRDEKGRVSASKTGERTGKLETVPSPYTSGVFEGLMNRFPDERWIGLLETNRGCPFSCSYCVWGDSSSNRVYLHDEAKIHAEIEWLAKHGIEFVFCCDANFGLLARDVEIAKKVAECKKRYGFPKSFSVQNTKNSAPRFYEIYRVLSESGLSKGVSLSLQSMNGATLKSIRRQNISLDTFKELQSRFSSDGIETFTDLIIGLPDETYESFADGVSTIIENGQHNRIQFINLTILTNSEMDDPGYQRKYGFETVETKLINIHGSLGGEKGARETQRLVVATGAMPRDRWASARVFGWTAALLHFDKLLQIPFVILNQEYSISYREMLESFIDDGPGKGVIGGISKAFREKAAEILEGGSEYCQSREWLDIWWPIDELTMIKLCAEKKTPLFYREAAARLKNLLERKGVACDEGIVRDALKLNEGLIKMPFLDDDVIIELEHNIWEVYEAAKRGRPTPLAGGGHAYRVDRARRTWSSWEEWSREVVWYGNKKGAYLYRCENIKGAHDHTRK